MHFSLDLSRRGFLPLNQGARLLGGDMDLQRLQTFTAVVDEGSMSAAARRLHLTQPAVTAQVRNLEREVGGVLFERGPHGCVPTVLAQRLLPHARIALAEIDVIAEEARRAADDQLTVGFTATTPLTLLAATMTALGPAAAGVRLVPGLAPWDTQLLIAERLDVALLEGPILDPRLVTTTLLTDGRGVCVGPRHPLFHSPGEGLTGASLAGLDMLHMVGGAPASWLRHCTFADDRDGELLRVVTPVVTSAESAVIGALTAPALVFAPARLAATAARAGLRYIGIPGRPSELVACRRRTPVRAALRTFLAVLASVSATLRAIGSLAEPAITVPYGGRGAASSDT